MTFVQSEDVIPVISMAEHYHQKPSQILGLYDEYTAYCFDQACFYLVIQLKDKRIPVFPNKQKNIGPGKGQFSNMYKQLGVAR